MGVLLGGLMTLPIDEQERKVFGRRWPRGLSRAGAIAIACVMFVRCCSAGAGESMHMAGSARIVDRLVDERDIALSGTRVLVASGMLQDDRDELPSAMREAYKQMSAAQGDVPSPVLATYLGLQSPDAYDMVLIDPPGDAKPTDAVVFLHGYAGNFSLPCWQVAEALEGLNVLTACPSTRWIGDWGSANGEATLRNVVNELHARGVTKIVLAGLSNGGYGASQLAPRMRGSFAGLVLVSGATESAGDPGCPTLLIHGRKDEMADYGDALQYRAKHPSAKIVTLEAGHFAMLVRSAEANKALRDFVVNVTGARGARGQG
jgi:pimeloyl-ACP methyl ester carboxylesterase